MSNYEMNLLTTKEEKKWNALLERVPTPDIYYTPAYAKIYEHPYSNDIDEAFGGEAGLFFFGNDQDCVLYPFMKRAIHTLPFMKKEHEELYDIISPYGYSGPIISCTEKNKEKELIKQFLDSFDSFCKQHHIITEFIRFHPLLKNHELFQEFIPIDMRNQTVYVNLTKDTETLFKEMDKKTRNLIRKAEKNGILIEETTRREDLATFTNIYLDTMEKNQAHAKYLFPQIFYERTMDLLQDTISLFVAKYQEKIIAASLFMHQYDYIHYHFSGSDKNYRQYAPNNLLLWTVIQWGQQKGYKTFHLGGGLGQDESLFRFKAGFSDERARFCTASIIHDTETYQRLNKLKDALDKKKTSQEEPSSFFPYYRKP